MVAQSGDVASQSPQHPKLRRVRVEDGLHQSAHREVPGIQNQSVGIGFLGLIDESLDLGKTSQGDIRAVFYREKAVQVGMGVMQE